MATNFRLQSRVEDKEEYVLLDLDCVSGLVDIPPNAPYVLSGLDTLNPVLVIDNKIKLIGDYEETIGTCIVFSESEVEATSTGAEETEPPEESSSSGKCAVSGNRNPAKQVKPIASLHKILRFRLLSEAETEAEPAKQSST